MNKLIDFIKHREIPLCFILGFILFLGVIISYFSRGFLIFGGEGNYFLDFSLVKDIYRYAWHPILMGVGFSNPILNFSFGIFDFFSFLQKLGLSFKSINLLSVILVYFLPFISIYWLLKVILKLDLKITLLVSLFYILNPFTTIHLQGIMFWNAAPLFVFPLIFGIIYKYYFDQFKLFFIFGITISIFSFSLANIPYLGIFHILLLISVIIISYLHKNKFDYKIAFRNFFILEMSFIFFSAWWLINLFRYYLQDLDISTFVDSIIRWIAGYYTNDHGIINKIFTLNQLMTSNLPGYSLSAFYFNNFVNVILYIPIIILVISLVFKTNRINKSLIALFLFLLLIFFFNKGANAPLGFIYVWMLKNIPTFNIFNAPTEKFSVLFVFIFAITLSFALKTYKKRIVYYAMGIYLLVCSLPYLTLNFIPDYPLGDNQYVSRIFTDKQEYKDVRNIINNEKLDYRLLSLPGSLNYQVTMYNHDNKYYRGMDPLMYSINKGFIAAYSSPEIENIVFHNLSNSNLNSLLSIYNVKRIMLNKDMVPSFGFAEKESFDGLDNIFSQNSNKWSEGRMELFSYNTFIPHFYAPKTLITTPQSLDVFSKIVSQQDYNIRSAIYFGNNQITTIANPLATSSEIFNPNELKKETINNTPIIEFKKINPTKYRVVIHHATENFPLIFSESFHDGWKSYLEDYKKVPVNFNQSDYKILDGNGDDQASAEELKNYINSGYISSLGNLKTETTKHVKWVDNREVFDYNENYKIDFISKNFQDTIQNDNLASGSFYETWLNKPVDDNQNHLMVNGYANSWNFNPGELCLNNAKCVKNADGSYDLELVIEFWPQRLFYIGLFISGVTLFGCLGYLGWDFVKRRKGKKKNYLIEENRDN